MSYATVEFQGSPVARTLRRVVPWLILALVLGGVASALGKYQEASELAAKQDKKMPASLAGTSTASPSKTKSAKGKTPKQAVTPKPGDTVVVVLQDGLNFRPKPDKASDALRGLDKGERLVWIATRGSWYQVRASDGRVGWVSAGRNYTRRVKEQ